MLEELKRTNHIMNIFHALLLGLIQGLTEFIPVSSTAHLLIGQEILGIPPSDAIFSFLVIVQLGTIASLVAYFWRDLLKLVVAFFAKPFSTPENRLGWFIIVATIPALLAGYLLKSVVQALFSMPLLEAAIRLIITAGILVLAEELGKRNRNLDSMTWLDALIIGLFQIISVFPGASRSGTTISAGMLRGLERKDAARFAFLMSIPIMLAAGGYQILDVIRLPDLASFFLPLAIGFITAGIVGWLAVRWLLGYLNRHTLYIFAAYCAIVGAVCLVLVLI
jgi:undecaprenyl-diphosphatase